MQGIDEGANEVARSEREGLNGVLVLVMFVNVEGGICF